MSEITEAVNTEIKTTLVLKNVTVNNKRTSIRLEPEMWSELKNIAQREQCTIHDICSLINLRKSKHSSLTAAIRVFLMLYFRAAATESGHEKAGHGSFDNMKRRAGVVADWSSLKIRQTTQQDDIEKRLALHLMHTKTDSKKVAESSLS